MKALISAFALLAFVTGTTLPIESSAQTTGTGQTMAPDTSTSTAPTSTKKKKSSKTKEPKEPKESKPKKESKKK